MKILEWCFFFPFVIPLCYSALFEGFDYSIDLHLEQWTDIFQPFFAVVWL